MPNKSPTDDDPVADLPTLTSVSPSGESIGEGRDESKNQDRSKDEDGKRPGAGEVLGSAKTSHEIAKSGGEASMDNADGCLAVTTTVVLCGLPKRHHPTARLVLMTLQNVLLVVSTIFVLAIYADFLSLDAEKVHGLPDNKIEALFFNRQCMEDQGWIAGYRTCTYAVRPSEIETCALDESLVEFGEDTRPATGNASGTTVVASLGAVAPRVAGDTRQASSDPRILSLTAVDSASSPSPGMSSGDTIVARLSEPCARDTSLTYREIFLLPSALAEDFDVAVSYRSSTEVVLTITGLPYPRPPIFSWAVGRYFSLRTGVLQKLVTPSGEPFSATLLRLTGSYGTTSGSSRSPGVAAALTSIQGDPEVGDTVTLVFSEPAARVPFANDYDEHELFLSGTGFSIVTRSTWGWHNATTAVFTLTSVSASSLTTPRFQAGSSWSFVRDSAFRAASDGVPFQGSFTLAPGAAPAGYSPGSGSGAGPGSTAPAAPQFDDPVRVTIPAPAMSTLPEFTAAELDFPETPSLTATFDKNSRRSGDDGGVSLQITSPLLMEWVRGDEREIVDTSSSSALLSIPDGAYVLVSGGTSTLDQNDAKLAQLGFVVPSTARAMAGIAAKVGGLFYSVEVAHSASTSKVISATHAPGTGDHRWEFAFDSLTEANADEVAAHVAKLLSAEPASRVTVIPAGGANSTRASARNTAAATARASKIKVSARTDAARADFLASRYGGPDPPSPDEAICADEAGGAILSQYAIVAVLAMIIIPIQVATVIAHGYYEELGCACITNRIGVAAGDGEGEDTVDAHGLSPRMVGIVCDILPRYVPDKELQGLSIKVVTAAMEAGDHAMAEKARIWVERAKRNKVAVCHEIYEASVGAARKDLELAKHIEGWKKHALKFWGRVVKIKAIVPVVITAFLDGAFMLHKVVDAEKLVYTGDGIPVDWVQVTMLAPIFIMIFLLVALIFNRLAKRTLAKEEARDAEAREYADKLDAMDPSERDAVIRKREAEVKARLVQKHKGKKKITDKMIEKEMRNEPTCSSNMMRTVVRVCLWSAAIMFVVTAALGAFVKLLAVGNTLSGNIGAGVQIALNVTDILYVILAAILVAPKLARLPRA